MSYFLDMKDMFKKQTKNWMFDQAKASAVMRFLQHSVVLKRELLRKANSRCLSRYSSPLCGHQYWVMAERARSQMQACEMIVL